MAAPYHRNRPPSGRQAIPPALAPPAHPRSATLPPAAVPESESDQDSDELSIGDATSELDIAIQKAFRVLKLRFDREVAAGRSAELTMAEMRASEGQSRAQAAETKATKLERKASHRGMVAIASTVGSVVSLGLVIAISKSIKSLMGEDIEESKEATEALDTRIEKVEKGMEELRTDMKVEIASEFQLLRIQILSALQEQPPPIYAPERPKKTKKEHQ